jgi:hypothetical protein
MHTRSKLKDRVLLVGAALAVCLTAMSVLLVFKIYHVDSAWFFFAWSAIVFIPMLRKEFRDYFKRPGFFIFFAVWMSVHGAVVAGMVAWTPMGLWPLILLVEFAVGFIAAHYLFGFELRGEPPAG